MKLPSLAFSDFTRYTNRVLDQPTRLTKIVDCFLGGPDPHRVPRFEVMGACVFVKSGLGVSRVLNIVTEVFELHTFTSWDGLTGTVNERGAKYTRDKGIGVLDFWRTPPYKHPIGRVHRSGTRTYFSLSVFADDLAPCQ